MSDVRLAEILLIEDSPDDVLLTHEALSEAKVANRLHVVGDGDQALDFLRHEGTFADVPRPDLIVLDFNLPRRDGREVLAEVRADPELRAIPVVVLTASPQERDVLHAHDHDVDAYIRKPLDLEQLLAVVRRIDNHWLGIVTRAA